MWEIFLLAVGSMFWPLLLAVDVLAFKTDRPVAILSGFLTGGLITTVAVGSAIVFSLEGTSLVTSAKRTTDASVDIVVGVLALVGAALIYRRRPEPKAEDSAPHKSNRVERLVARGGILAFAGGIVANVFPGVLPFVALKDIAELDYSAAETVLVIVGFYLVMFTFIEVPIIGYLVAPERTSAAVASFNVWLSRNLWTLAWSALAILGTFELVRGIVVALR
jgi:Sap, sulfolipid-1-addressing protein